MTTVIFWLVLVSGGGHAIAIIPQPYSEVSCTKEAAKVNDTRKGIPSVYAYCIKGESK